MQQNQPEIKRVKQTFSKASNPLYSSQMPDSQGETFQLFVIPKAVTQALETYEEFLSILEEHVKNQKLAIDLDFKALKEEIMTSIDEVSH